MKAPALVLVHRRELATQGCNRLREFGVDYGLIMAGELPRPWARVQVASVQTLIKRRCPPAALVICDEAHLSTAATWQKILDQYPNAKILGLTATPWRLSGKPLVGAYDACVVISTPRELREAGYLSPYAGFSYLTPDLEEVSTVGGEYNEGESAEAMRAPQIVANVVEMWLAHASKLSTICFAVTVEHSRQLTAEFKAAGVKAEHLDGTTPLQQRKAILARLESGACQVLCNVGVAVEGLDVPRVKCIIDACPTKSLARAIQKWGRGRRPWNGLTCRIHDHAFNIRLHGLPDADRDYTLSAKPADLPSLSTCSVCFATYAGPKCPACGVEKEPAPLAPRELVTVPDAERFEFSSEEAAAEAEWAALGPAPEPAPIKQAVEVKWTRVGQSVEGILERRWETKEQFGTVQNYYLRGINGKRDHRFNGTRMLNDLLLRVQIPDSIRIEYVRDQPIRGKDYAKKIFRVQRVVPDEVSP